MGDRSLVVATEEDDDLGLTYHLVVTRSPMGPPGGWVSIARVEANGDDEELSIEIPDLTVLETAVEWARGTA